MKKSMDSYVNYVCPYCFNTLDNCTCELFPPYHLKFIDRNIQEHVRILNQKGYKSTGCCESHYQGVCTCIYISFATDYGFGNTVPLPEGFKLQKNKFAIVYDYEKKITENEMSVQKELKLKSLLEWCKAIPSLC